MNGLCHRMLLPVSAALCRGRAKEPFQLIPSPSTALAAPLLLPPHTEFWAVLVMPRELSVCLSVLKWNNFWPEGMTVGESKSGPLLLQKDESKVSLLCWRAQGAARHCSEMWHHSVASECHLCVGKRLPVFFLSCQKKESSCSKHWGQCLSRHSPWRHTGSLLKDNCFVRKRSSNPHTDPHQWF